MHKQHLPSNATLVKSFDSLFLSDLAESIDDTLVDSLSGTGLRLQTSLDDIGWCCQVCGCVVSAAPGVRKALTGHTGNGSSSKQFSKAEDLAAVTFTKDIFLRSVSGWALIRRTNLEMGITASQCCSGVSRNSRSEVDSRLGIRQYTSTAIPRRTKGTSLYDQL